MTPKLNPELSDAVRKQAGPLEVQDAAGELRYVIVGQDEYRALVDGEFRRWLQVGLDQEASGESAEWNTAEILAEARRRHLDLPKS
jgi:hypothetical protein